MDDTELRDHAHQMLSTFADDLDTLQTAQQRDAKSEGRARREVADTAAEVHAEARLLSGYTAVQLVSEYRALRASVLTLWAAERHLDQESDMNDMIRFNEAIDQALAESVARYEFMVKRSQNMFLAILGHDLRNPLGTVVIGSNFIMEAVDIPPKYILVATRMFNSAKRMSRLVSDLIDFTRTHLGPGIPIRTKPGDLVKVCKDVINEMRTFHSEMQIDIRVPTRLEAQFDDNRVAQMLSNLVGNAIQYGAPDLPVSIDVRYDDTNAVIAINNHGATIASDKLSSIFDPMVRIASDVQSDASDRTSLGIGLFISREIAHAHGGQIGVESNAVDGTTFTVTLPLQGRPVAPTAHDNDDSKAGADTGQAC